MYKYVVDVQGKAVLKKSQSTCSKIMRELEVLLRQNYKINTQFFLVGSGGNNMVTQNESGEFDFDYNLNVYNGFQYKGNELKEDIRKAANEIMSNYNVKYSLNDVSDSTSALTTNKIRTINNNGLYSMDICIVTQDNDMVWHKLKHKKTGNIKNDEYFWNIIPDSEEYVNKSRIIKKKAGWWDKVREHYLKLKNDYLKSNDNDYPSFICYIQAVNDVYNEMEQKKLIK